VASGVSHNLKPTRDAVLRRIIRWFATVWKRFATLWGGSAVAPPQCGDGSGGSTPQCGDANQPAPTVWTEYIPPCAKPTAVTLTRAFTHWAVAQPDHVRMALMSSYVRRLYQDAYKANVGWPPYKDFAAELKKLMPRRRHWREGCGKSGPTVYGVPSAYPEAVVEIAAADRRRA
jgi:hypothetical protein